MSRTPALLAVAGAAGLVVPWLVPWLPAGGVLAWLADLATHWQWLYMPMLAVGMLAGLRRDRPAGRFGRLPWVLAGLLLPAPWLTASPRQPQASSTLAATTVTVASANVEVYNTEPERLVAWLHAERPDLVALVELRPGFAAGLQALEGYPYREVLAGPPRGSGVGLLSRWPVRESRVLPGPGGHSYVEAIVELHGRPVRVVVFHPMPPSRPLLHVHRDTGLRLHAERSAASGLPSLLVGDLNATPWSSAFAVVGSAGWRRAGTLAPSWPSVTARLGWGIPIDHVLASPDWQVLGWELGPHIGSDHLPVLARLALPAPAVR